MSDTRVTIQNIIQTQIPEFLNEESPLFKEFLDAYYVSQEHKTGTVELASDLSSLKDLKKYNNELFASAFVPALLVADVTAFDTDIAVSHTIGFPDRDGLIKIDNEIIYYKNKSSQGFSGCSRAFSAITTILENTTSNYTETEIAPHSAGARVANLSLVFYGELFKKFKSQFLPGFEERQFIPQVEITNVLSRAVDFYTSKGTDTSFKLLFRALYGEPVEVIKPQEYLLRPSDDSFFVTKNILVEKISGSDPLKLNGETVFQETGNVEESSAAIYLVEYRPVDGKDLYEISFDSSSFLYSFRTTKKSNVSKKVTSGSTTINVDSTVGFANSGTLKVSNGSVLYDVTYTERTNTQFLGCSGIVTDIEFGSEVLESNFAYAYDKDGEKVEFRIINVIGNIDFSNTSNLLEEDKITLSSFGAELSEKSEFNSWIYNNVTNHQIKSIVLGNDPNGTRYRIEFFDNINFFLDQEVTLRNLKIASDDGLSATVENLISDTIIEVQCNQNCLDKDTLTTDLMTGKSDQNKTPSVSDIPISIQNTYIDDKYENFYVAASGLPNYPLYAKEQIINTSTQVSVGNTNTLDTDVVHKFYTGEKIYYNPSTNSGIGTGIYYVTTVGDIKDSKKIKLSLSKSDLFSKKYITFKNISGDSFVKLDYENKVVENQKLFKKFNYIKGDSSLREVADRTTNNRQIGLLANGIELYSPSLFDENIYYGKLQSILVTNPGKNYDVINPPELEIKDVSGSGASGYLNISGGLRQVKIITPGIGYQTKPKITLIGGNGRGAVVEPNLVKSQITSGFQGDGNGVNPTTDIITFINKHNFDNGEQVSYITNGNSELQPFKEDSVYFVGVEDSKSIKLYDKESDALQKVNPVNIVGISSGFHSFKTLESKNTITRLYVNSTGSGYSNKLIKIPSLIAYDGTNNGVNTWDYYVYAADHQFKNRDIVRYRTTGSEIAGLSTSKEYVVTVLDNNKFKLSDIGGEDETFDKNYRLKKYIDLTSVGVGTHTFAYPPIRLKVETLSGIGATTVIEPEFEPIVLGSIDSVFVESPGVGYGVSDVINFHRRPDIQIKDIKSEALLRPIVVNGAIVDVQFLTFGSGYEKGIDLIVTGEGTFADLRPTVDDNGRIVAVNIANGGIGYKPESTEITVSRRGVDAKFLGDVYEWKINQAEKHKEILSDNRDEAIIVPSKVKEFGLHPVNFYTPKLLRRTLKDHIDDANREVPDNSHSPIVGWAYDGNPIYGPYGLVGSSIQKIRSSYGKQAEPNSALRPSTFPEGFFLNDFYFDRAIGDLDEFNGRFCVTPEYPDGIYAYFTTIDNSAISKPEYPYVIGQSFRDFVIPRNYEPNFNQTIDISRLNLIRNTSPYYLNSNTSTYDLILKSDEKYKQEFTVSKTLKSGIDNIGVYASGEGYKVGDNVVFNNVGTDGTGVSAAVSRIKGKSINTIKVGVTTQTDVKLFSKGNNIIGITREPHGYVTGEVINVSSISDAKYSDLEGSREIFVQQKTSNLIEDIDVVSATGLTTAITVGDTFGFKVSDYIQIGDAERAQIVRIDEKNSQFIVNRLTNTGIHTVGISSIKLLPTEFRYGVDKISSQITANEQYYFDSKTLIGFGTNINNYTLPDNSNLSVPAGGIYIPNHNIRTGQRLKYHTGFGGTSIYVGQTASSTLPLADGSDVYAVNLGVNFIGLSTSPSVVTPLVIVDQATVTGSAHSLSVNFSDVTAVVEQFGLDVVTNKPHKLKNAEKVKFNLLPRLTDNFVIRYDTKLRKLTSEKISFDASQVGVNVSTNEIYLPDNTLNTGDKVVYYVGSGTTIGGLIDNETYFVIKEKPDFIRLSEFLVNANEGVGIAITAQGSGTQHIARINPPLTGTQQNIVKFDLSDPSLTGMDMRVFKDSSLSIELESYRYRRNSIEAGLPDAALQIDTSEEFIGNTLFYNIIPLAPNVVEKKQSSVDTEVVGNNKIILKPSIFNQQYSIVSIGTTTFKFNLKSKPEYFNYSVNSGVSTIFYDTDSTTTDGPISEVKINFDGRGYSKLPKIERIDSEYGTDAVLKASSETIGKIDSIDRVKDGFDYPTDPTLRPVLSVPSVCQIKDIARVDSIGITTGGKGYHVAPTLKVIGNDDIELLAFIQGGSVVDVSVVENTQNLNGPLKIVATRNSNGYDIDDIVYDSGTNEVTLELVNADSQIYPLSGEFPFKVGDSIFVENTRISDADTKNGYNSEDYNYRFFTVTGVNETNFTVTYSMDGFGTNLGEYNTDINYGYVINKDDIATFKMNIADDLGYFSNENVIGYNSLNQQVFSAKVMESGWNNDVNQLRLIDSEGELSVGDKLLGTRSRLFGTIENVSQFNLISSLHTTREKVNYLNDNAGYLNDYQQRIADNNYYQKFSYSLKSKLSYDNWKESVRSLVHPAGFKEFSDLDIISNTVSTNQNMKVGVGDSSLNILINVDNISSMYGRFNFSMVTEDELLPNGTIERIFFPDGVNLRPYILNKTNKVLKIDDISSNFTGFTTTTGGQIVGLTTFSLKNKGFPLFYREFDSTVEKNFTLSDDRFTFENHNFQSGQQLEYKIKESIKPASGAATTVVENNFSYPTVSTTIDSPIDSFDSIVRTFDAN